MKKKSEKMMPMMEHEMPGHAMDDSEAESHLTKLVEAHKIKNSPEKMAMVRKLAGRHKKILQDIEDTQDSGVSSVEDLKGIYQKKFGGGKK